MQIIQSNILKNFSNLTHGFTTRDGGVSQKPYNSLNLAFHVDDNSCHVESNHELLAKRLDYNREKVVHMKQIHSDIVHIVNEDDNFNLPIECDALITNRKNTPLMVMVADCSPILFYDDVQKVIAVAHAGRQGTFKNIVKKVINSMTCRFNSKTEDIYVAIGANIGKCCYEVGSEIYHEAKTLDLEYAFSIKEKSHYLDIRKILKSQLLASGIKKENLKISNECSCCKNDKYFSYRANGVTGRFCGVILLK
ncbi:MAG: peptidoglycan editing factor PgeF [Sulfurimonas sp.]|nr:peptidoglycan editing factor PgeF [Sulfurimonas sp.]